MRGYDADRSRFRQLALGTVQSFQATVTIVSYGKRTFSASFLGVAFGGTLGGLRLSNSLETN